MNLAATLLGLENFMINGADSYFLVGAYDGNGGVHLWVDNKEAGLVTSTKGSVSASGQPTLVGANPTPSSKLGTGHAFDGLVQQVGVLPWGEQNFSGSLVN